ncbi:spore ii p: stage ii sporulation protein p [Lucifera butyrica]|uniref:Spore ii p: stage ii sporulation protein p n=1 Tax=Lucifera butyrica TaxID=1351585 RepID=A0A498RAM6_9FIRM|nr:stage II sporulation protein P [Lucifera butyrica]VBB06168.1 spore ii p: stage ii sporulation protein p [Lucifera butyrica]
MNRIWRVVVFVSLLLLTLPAVSLAHERSDGGYYNIVDENGRVVFVTGWGVQNGDQFLTADNKRYEVTSVQGDLARAKFIGSVNLSQYMVDKDSKLTFWQRILSPSIARAQGEKVAIYHTHSDESYIPTDGKPSIYGAGGVYKVGDAFANALQKDGIQPIHSYAKHDPHDDMAYERSRRTVLQLLKQKPDAIFDVHRDATPPEVYRTTINGQDVTKVQLVVGKYGPTGKQIEDWALHLKAAADKKHPGLVKGIFFAKGGDYNQDLFPRSMLVEVGSDTNTRGEAERGIALFADAIPAVLSGTSPTPANQAGTAGVGTAASGPSGATKSIGWILGFLVVGTIAFLFLSTGGMKEAKSKLKHFGKTEFANFLGPVKRKNKAKENKEDHDQEPK